MRLSEEQYLAICSISRGEVLVKGQVSMIVTKHEKNDPDGFPKGWTCFVIDSVTDDGYPWKIEAVRGAKNRSEAIEAGLRN